MVSNLGVLNRRQFLKSLFPMAIAKPVISHQSLTAKPLSPLPGISQPEFWFGEKVQFHWTDENSGDRQSECGEVVGVLWNSPGARWEYQVNWLSSTVYPTDDYPIVDGNFISADVLSKAGSAY